MNAVKTILPHFHSLYNAGPKTEPVKEYVPLANLSSPNVSTPPERGWVYKQWKGNMSPNIIAGKGEFRDVFHVIIACAFTGCLVPSSLHLLHNNESKTGKHKRIKIVSFPPAGAYT